ncbi:HK97-gp10 family putative phage morphogenesis protein [Embleya sp. NPDC050154]|uniref:HK97-gp10 family putative phage morphogenesis protein n=1 Tax=Embleya sp. NPDC050154 TaxID=3363988 RepID=UPI0037A7C14C
MSVGFQIDGRAYERGLRRWIGRISDGAKDAMTRTGMRMVREAQERCPVDTGRLRSSIRHSTSGSGRSWTVTVGTNVNYAPHVEFGTRPHIILPKHKRALYWKGALHPVAVVHHPGTKPKPFLRPAIARAPAIWAEEAPRAAR